MSRNPLFGIYDVRTPEEKYADGWDATFGKHQMKEIEVEAGEWIGSAVRRLVASAPAFCVFNNVRLEARPGESADDVWRQWTAAMRAREAAQPKCCPTCQRPM